MPSQSDWSTHARIWLVSMVGSTESEGLLPYCPGWYHLPGADTPLIQEPIHVSGQALQ